MRCELRFEIRLLNILSFWIPDLQIDRSRVLLGVRSSPLNQNTSGTVALNTYVYFNNKINFRQLLLPCQSLDEGSQFDTAPLAQMRKIQHRGWLWWLVSTSPPGGFSQVPVRFRRDQEGLSIELRRTYLRLSCILYCGSRSCRGNIF